MLRSIFVFDRGFVAALETASRLREMIHGTKIILSILFILSELALSPAWSVEVGDHMPEFTLQAFDGSTSSHATLQGRPLLLIFWNTWCPNCMEELPKINNLAKEFRPKGLAVLAINTAINDSESKARAYWMKHGFVFPSGFDQYFELGDAFGVRGVPTIFLFDSKGVVRYKQARIPENMEERFEQLTGKESHSLQGAAEKNQGRRVSPLVRWPVRPLYCFQDLGIGKSTSHPYP